MGRFVTAVLIALAGCTRFGFEAAHDARIAADVGGAIAEAGPSADGTPGADRAWVDAAPPPDARATDAPPPADAPVAVEGPPPTDAPVAVDGPPPTGACAAGVTPIAWLSDMVICDEPSGTNHCEAPSRCNGAAGWHLCTASEYVARGGATSGPPNGDRYWLAACVRDGAAPFAPQDGLCATDCSIQSGVTAPVSWSCAGGAGGSLATNELHVGLRADPSCHRAGVDAKANEAFWWSTTVGSRGSGALCCR